MVKGSSQPKLQVSALSVRYDKVCVLEDIEGTFEPNTLTAIIGPNGAGKSTLLKAIMGVVTPFKGDIKNSFSRTAYLPQRNEIDVSFPMSVFELVALGTWNHMGAFKSLGSDEYKKVQHALEKVGLSSHQSALLHTLSGGQFQRALFARLWLQDAALILLDEPFTGIDRRTTKDLLHIIQQWHKEGKTIIAVLHDLRIVQEYFPDTLFLEKTVHEWGKTKNILRKEEDLHAHLCVHPPIIEDSKKP